LTEADYFTLSHRENAYLNISCFVGQYPEYLESMLQHLAFEKLQHCDANIRRLASQALSLLSVFNPEMMVKTVLSALIEKCFSKALHIRHGAILGVSEILIGLSGHALENRQDILDSIMKSMGANERTILKDSEGHAKFRTHFEELSNQNYLPTVLPEDSDIMNELRNIIHRVEKERLYRGVGGEIMREGVCHLIFSLSTAKVQMDNGMSQQLFKNLLENFKHPKQEIQDEAAKAFKIYCETYYAGHAIEQSDHLVAEVTKMFEPS